MLACHAVAVALLVGGTTAFVSLDKTVTVSIDGKVREVRSFGRTVGDVLEREGITIGPHDAVAPPLGTPVSEGTRVAVRHGRLLTLTVDEATRQVWVTATSVQEALETLGLRADGAFLSASRSRRIPLDGMSLELRTSRDLVFLADHKRHEVTTTAETVRQALDDAGLELGKKDKVSAPLTAFPDEGQVIRVTRILGKRVEVDVDIPYETVERATNDLFEDETDVVQPGRSGLKVKVYAVKIVDGEQVSRRLVSSKIVEKPRTQIVRVGTKDRPTGADGLNWDALAECESGGDPDAYNPAGPYYGLYQFSQSTWESVGGSGVPTDASPSEQTYRAQLLYQQAGDEQWPVCGENLYT